MRSTHVRVFLRIATVAIWAVGVCACGGGGGGGGSPNPVLGATSFTTNENVTLSGSVTATDPGGGTVTFSQTANPTSGTLSNVTPAGQFTYTPNPNFTGSDSFGIQATDAGGNKTTATVTITVTVNKPPTANNTVVRSDDGLNINVLAASSDPDKDHLTVTVTDTFYGTAAANSDGTVSISGLSGFKGVTRFGFTVTDPSGATASAHMAVFVGTDPFRALFVGDANGDGSNEVYLTDFAAAAPVVVTKATQGNLRLKGFAASDNGATVVYRTQDTTAADTMHLSFVQTKTPTQDVAIPLPNGAVPIADGNGKDQLVVSPDGQWIALVAGQPGGSSSLYVVNVTKPTVVSPIAPSGSAYAAQPSFSPDSKNIYFLATGDATGRGRSLYFASLSNPATVALVSQLSNPASADDVTAYSVASDQSRILEQANRLGRIALYFIDPAKLTTEVQLNAEPPFGMLITGSTVGSAPGRGGSLTVARVAYTEGTLAVPDSGGAYVAEVSGTNSNPRQVAPSVAAIGLRPDDKALLYTDGSLVSEAVIDSGVAATSVGGGNFAWYDSTGNIVLLKQSLQSGLTNYPALAASSRGKFGATQQVGTDSMAADYVDTSGFDRGVVLIGQGAIGGSAPTSVQLQLVNALAERNLLPLADFKTPVQLTSSASKIVSTAN